jgi:excisionase family DNA binding protein
VFNVAPRTVTAWARSGRFPSTRTPGGQYRFRESDVDALLQEDDQPGPAMTEATTGPHAVSILTSERTTP